MTIDQPVQPGPTTRLPDLSDQQFKIFYYSVLGKKAKEIADLLDVATNTIYAHKQNITDRLRLKPKAWRQYAIEQGVIQAGG